MHNHRNYTQIVSAACILLLIPSCGYWPPSVSSSAEVYRTPQSHITLRVRGLNDKDIPSLQSRTNLQMLTFSDGHAVKDAKITDEGLLSLSRLNLANLRVLDLGYCSGFSNNGLSYLSHMSSVQDLRLVACPQVNNAGLKNLTRMKGLERLDLRGCAGISNHGLESLVSMRNLRTIELGGCPNISPSAVHKLQSRMPQARVVKDDREWSYHQ